MVVQLLLGRVQRRLGDLFRALLDIVLILSDSIPNAQCNVTSDLIPEHTGRGMNTQQTLQTIQGCLSHFLGRVYNCTNRIFQTVGNTGNDVFADLQPVIFHKFIFYGSQNLRDLFDQIRDRLDNTSRQFSKQLNSFLQDLR